MVERITSNDKVVGSTPAVGTGEIFGGFCFIIFFFWETWCEWMSRLSSLFEARMLLVCKTCVVGSGLATPLQEAEEQCAG